jgi:hypothetical protein
MGMDAINLFAGRMDDELTKALNNKEFQDKMVAKAAEQLVTMARGQVAEQKSSAAEKQPDTTKPEETGAPRPEAKE